MAWRTLLLMFNATNAMVLLQRYSIPYCWLTDSYLSESCSGLKWLLTAHTWRPPPSLLRNMCKRQTPINNKLTTLPQLQDCLDLLQPLLGLLAGWLGATSLILNCQLEAELTHLGFILTARVPVDSSLLFDWLHEMACHVLCIYCRYNP